MKLSALISNDLNQDCDVLGVTSNSKKVVPGTMFIAVSGHAVDGTEFIAEALERGALVVLANKAKENRVSEILNGDLSKVYFAEDTRVSLSEISARFYKGQPKNVAAVTGTSGKSSTVWFVRQILEGLGLSAASLGTIGLHAGDVFEKSALTTADPVTLHNTLQVLEDRGIDYMAMEASSIGIEQCRMDGVALKVAAFSNLSHEHLDYHSDMDAYFKAKQRLFTHCLSKDGYAVLNADIAEYKRLSDICDHHNLRVISYGIHADGDHDIKLVNRSVTDEGQVLVMSIGGVTIECAIKLIGAFQAQNVLCALAMVYGLLDMQLDASKIETILPTLKTVPGRLERIEGHPKGASIYVDYAHKPDALESVLNAVRPHTKGKLWVAFGCGGDRDRSKRSKMGQIAYDLADEVIITDDNPRTEDPELIRAEIASGFPSFKNIGDRRKAIDFATSSLLTGDTLIIAGKGHESGQTIHAQTLPFDDRDETRQSIQSLVNQMKDT